MGGKERNGKYGILTDGKEGKGREESVELCPVYIIAYWLFMPVHRGDQEEQPGWVAHGYVNEVLF